MRNIKVLIAGDEIALCDALKMVLEEHSNHYHIAVAYSGTQALSFLENEEFDVLVTDIRMPGINGIELMEKAGKIWRDLQTIIITGHGDIDNAIDALRLGAHNYIKKPISSEVLHFAVMNAWEKRELNRKLRESEAQFRNIFEQNTVPMLLTDPETRDIVNANKAASEFYGYSVSELIRMNISDISREQGAGEQGAGDREQGAGKFIRYHCLKNGEIRRIEEHCTLLEIQNEPMLFSIIHDIEDRMKAEAALKESEAQYREMFENMNDGVAVYEPVNDGEDFIFTDFNKAGEKIDGVSRKDLIGNPVSKMFPGIKDFGLFEVFQKVWKTGTPQSHPIGFYKDERLAVWRENYVYKLPDGKIVAIYRDETEKKQTEAALRESEKRYRTLFDSAADAIFVHEFGTPFLDVSRSACERLGYTREELLQMTPGDIAHPEYTQLIPGRLEALRENGYVVFEAAQITRDGETIPVEGNSRVIEYRGKKAVMTVSRDIRERKQAEEERELLLERLRQAQKMESIGTLAGGIAHDFNNILSPIIGYTEMTAETLPQDSTARSNLNEVLRAAYRARDLVRQILVFSRHGEQEQIPLNLQYIVKEVIKMLSATLPATIEIRHDIKRDCGIIRADPAQMHQILMNLCTNAYHAMPEKGGILEITLDNTEITPDDLAAYPGVSPGDYVRLSVSDTGHGMNQEVMARIFDPYFTTKDKGKGTGLGLSVVHGIVKHHYGHINVYSEPGKGTAFHIYLPMITEKLPKPKPAYGLSAIPGGNERILLVDDETAIVEMEQQVLERLGYKVAGVSSATDALNVFRKDPKGFDLIITDTTMPEMTGVDLCREILKIRPDMPIILCTGFSEIITKEKAIEMGIREFLMKPVLIKDMAKTIRKLMDCEA